MRAYDADSSSVCDTVVEVPSVTSARKSSRCVRFSAVICPSFANRPASTHDARQSQQLARKRGALVLARRQVHRDRGLALELEDPERQPRRQLLLARRDGDDVIAAALLADAALIALQARADVHGVDALPRDRAVQRVLAAVRD